MFGFNSFDEQKYGSVLDNDYFKIEAYAMVNNKMQVNQKIELEKCKNDDVKWIKVSLDTYYKNAICFKDKSQVQLQADWFYKKNMIPFVSITHCKGKTTCKSLREAKEFVQK